MERGAREEEEEVFSKPTDLFPLVESSRAPGAEEDDDTVKHLQEEDLVKSRGNSSRRLV